MNKEKIKAVIDTAKSYVMTNRMKCTIVAVYILLAILGLIMSRGVKINYNLSDYLSEDTETSIALKIMTDEFGMTGNIQVMLTGIEKDEAKNVKALLSEIDGVLTVSFDSELPTAYKEETKAALFNILVDGEDHSDTAKNVIAEVKSSLGEKYGAVELGGSTIEYNALRENTGKEMGLIIVLSISLAALLLLVTASSWIEPIILLAASGIAIAINMGLNLFLGEISYITNSVSSILQLALSVDYSIVLIHAYRDEKRSESDNTEAMRRAVKMVMNPVSASALTTIAGLIALLFMSFTIGFDIGITLIKGIVISAITAITLLPVIVLMLDPLLEKTKKMPFVPKGDIFSGFAFKWNKAAVPAAAGLILVSAVLQGFNSYGFTDSIGTNKNIVDTFGRNDSIVIVYNTGDDREEDYKKEGELKALLESYKNEAGKAPLASFTGYSTTVRELYTVDRATAMLGVARSDVEMLFSLYNLYTDNSALTLTAGEFVDFTKSLIGSDDEDVAEMVTPETERMIELIASVKELMPTQYTASELYNRITDIYSLLSDSGSSGGISEFAIKQIYGVKYYDRVTGGNKINAKTFVHYAVDKAAVLYQNGDITKEQYDKTVKLEDIIRFENSALTWLEPNFNSFYGGSYSYEEFLPALKRLSIASGIDTGKEMVESIQQFYIMYFYDNGRFPTLTMRARDFVKFVTDQIPSSNPNANPTVEAGKNSVIGSQAASVEQSLKALSETDKFLFGRDSQNNDIKYTYKELAQRLSALQSSTGMGGSGNSVSDEIISGVYIKYASSKGEGNPLLTPMMAFELLDFVSENMHTNSLLASRMDEETQKKVDDAKALIASADGLFVGDEYSRVLISVVLPAEGPEMVAFIDYLLESIDNTLGEDAYITGKVVSTYDLQAAFDVDNLIITLFTIISILLVILFVFKSLSLPVILVLVIQGAVWISLSLCLIGGGLIFFMSYIVTTCILMGATVDYGILMSNNYIVYRKDMDKEAALKRAVDSAMPTVFTSGIILIVCGIVISFISSQNSIASVGTLLAQGTFVSILMITLGLPSILYLLDAVILKFTMNEEQTARLYQEINKRTSPAKEWLKKNILPYILKAWEYMLPFMKKAWEYLSRFVFEAKKRAIPLYERLKEKCLSYLEEKTKDGKNLQIEEPLPKTAEAAEEQATKDSASEEPIAEEPKEDAPAEAAVTEDAPAEDILAEDAPAEEVVTDEPSVEAAREEPLPEKPAPKNKAAAKSGTTKSTAAKSTAAKKTAEKKTDSAKSASAKTAAAKTASAKKTSAAKSSTAKKTTTAKETGEAKKKTSSKPKTAEESTPTEKPAE